MVAVCVVGWADTARCADCIAQWLGSYGAAAKSTSSSYIVSKFTPTF